jgi:hypothetical protein
MNAKPIAEPIKTAIVTTLVTTTFLQLAKHHGMTPELLASLALQSFATNPPLSLIIESPSPLNEQACDSCPVRPRCDSHAERRRWICFEKLEASTLPVASSVALTLLLGISQFLGALL